MHRASIILTTLLIACSFAARAADEDTTRVVTARETIMVEDDRDRCAATAHCLRTLRSTDDLMAEGGAISLVRRANFAAEALVRGMGGGQIAVTIDGMKLFSACTDHMDPATSYIEIDNLAAMTVSEGTSDLSNGQVLGGGVNMQRPTAALDETFTRGRVSYDGVSGQRALHAVGNHAFSESTALRLSGTIRAASDFYAGDRTLIDGSGFAKQNVGFDLTQRLGASTIDVAYIGDFSQDVGFPSLIMDTRQTIMHFGSLRASSPISIAGFTNLSTRIYGNTVLHWMDDADRSDAEVSERPIMPGMRMPMYGTTTTLGTHATFTRAGASSVSHVIADLYWLRAFADMTMTPLDTTVSDMYLVSIANASIGSFGIAADHEFRPADELTWRLAGRVDLALRSLLDDTWSAVLLSYQPSGTTIENGAAGTISTTLRFEPESSGDDDARTATSLTVARAQRLPTHQELFGYYLYDVATNSIMIGAPALRPETAWQVDATWELNTTLLDAPSSVSVRPFVSFISDHIGSRPIEGGNVPGDTSQQFRQVANVGEALITGATLQGSIGLGEHWRTYITAEYLYGQSVTLDEPLPFIQPLTAHVRVVYRSTDVMAEVTFHGATRQTRTARTLAVEDQTSGWFTADLRARWDVASWITLQGGIENLADRLYHTHLSVNNLPSRGRNFYAQIEVRWNAN